METPDTRPNQMQRVSLFDAVLGRRSRRFALGMNLPTGPLAFQSQRAPEPLGEEQEAALAFAACGVTGYALAELPYGPSAEPESSGGNIMTHFVARTIASGDAMHDCTVFVINDSGTWMLKRPQDYSRREIPELIRHAQEGRLVHLYHKARVKIADSRLDVPRHVPFVAPFNKWMANITGTTYFLPVAELSALYINVMLSVFDEDFATFVVDDRNNYQPAGIAAFARSAGGKLHDDPAEGRVLTVSFVETWICEFVAIEQGAIHQNLGLTCAALALGGFPHFAAHPFAWPLALGFRAESVSYNRLIGLPPGGFADLAVPSPVGLERDGDVLLKPFCPPYYRSMEEAVLAFLDYKYEEGRGTFRDGGAATGWLEGAAIQAAIPRYSDKAVEATIAYCRYLYERYGRFPVSSAPFRTVLAFQAHRLDPDFYARFYRREAAGNTGLS
jgi:hypothetical protein